MKASEYSPTCTWIGEDAPSHLSSCNQPSVLGKSYCCDHVWRVYQEGSAVKPRKKAEGQRNSLQDLVDDFNAVVEELSMEDEV